MILVGYLKLKRLKILAWWGQTLILVLYSVENSFVSAFKKCFIVKLRTNILQSLQNQNCTLLNQIKSFVILAVLR